MNEDELNEKWANQTNELYRSIGEFIVNFEHICSTIQRGIIFLLREEGLKNEGVSQIIVAGMTAEPLRVLFESLIGEIKTLNTIENKILKNALNRFRDLSQERNDTVHSTWFIGWGNHTTTDFTKASGMKFHKNKKGATMKSSDKKHEDFDALTVEAQALLTIFLRLHACLIGGHKFEDNFIISKDGKVSVPLKL